MPTDGRSGWPGTSPADRRSWSTTTATTARWTRRSRCWGPTDRSSPFAASSARRSTSPRRHGSCQFNDPAALEAALADRDVAAVLIEPALTNVGIVLPEPGYLDAVRDLTRRTGTLLIIDETHTICAGPGGATAAWGLEPDLLVIGKTIGGGIPSAAYGFSAEVAGRIHGSIAEEDSDVGGIGGTLAGYALSLAATRATLGEVLTGEAFARMIPLAERWEAGVAGVIADEGVPWHVTRLGARAEYHFMPDPPRTGAEQWAHSDPDLERFLHLWAMNRRVLMTPFHNMALMSPSTTADDVDRHTTAFGEAVGRCSADATRAGAARAAPECRSAGRERPLEPVKLGCWIERAAMLPIGRCLRVDPGDPEICRLDGGQELATDACLHRPGRMWRSVDDRFDLGEAPADLLVRFDPRRRDTRVPKHPVGHRPVARRAIVLDRQPLADVRQVVERSGIHGVADLALDQALPGGTGLDPAGCVASLRAHGPIVSDLGGRRHRHRSARFGDTRGS